jgi:hypothetical protein
VAGDRPGRGFTLGAASSVVAARVVALDVETKGRSLEEVSG